MLVNIDVKGLEWVTIVWFAQDPVGMDEILKGVDQHSVNQRVFGLPERRIAKIFVFRLIYGGSKWAYALDPDFNWISKSPKYWQKVIDKFYDKYSGIKRQHDKWVQEAVATGRLVMPTGRIYLFRPYKDERSGELKWPRTQILNYPVQGTGHDIVTIARVSLWKRINASPIKDSIKFISTVHDSIVIDCNFNQEHENFGTLLRIINGVFSDVNRNFSTLFGVDLNLPIQAEIKVGQNLLDMQLVS